MQGQAQGASCCYLVAATRRLPASRPAAASGGVGAHPQHSLQALDRLGQPAIADEAVEQPGVRGLNRH